MAIRIIEISSNDRLDLVESIISLLVEQMKKLGKDHSAEEIRSAVVNALKPESRGLFFIAYGDDNPTETEPAGFCFINICSGIEAGGDYVWINEIHTRADRRSQGVGLALVKHVIDWGEKNNCRYIAGITSLKNRAARNLFAHYGFNDNQVIWLDKTL